MASIFNGDDTDTKVTNLTLQTIEATSVESAIQALDAEVTVFRNSVQLNPLDVIINGIKDDIDAIDISNVNATIATKLDITTYDANVPGYQTAANVTSSINSALTPYRTSTAQDIIDLGKYSTSNPAGYQTSSQVTTSINSALTPYRTSAAQDIIDSGKYSTSNPAGYQTAANVTSSINSALTPYRTSADEDIINATKLNTADLKAPIIPFEVAGGFIPSSVSIKGVNAYYDTGFYSNPGTLKTLQYSDAPLFDSNLLINDFNAASYGCVGPNLYETTDGITWVNVHTFGGGAITIIYMKKVGNFMLFQDSSFNVYTTDNVSTFPLWTTLTDPIRDTMYSPVYNYHYVLTTDKIYATTDFVTVDINEQIVDENSIPVTNANFLLEDQNNGLVGIAFVHPETRVLTNSNGNWNSPALTATITLASTFQQMTDIIRYGLTNQHYYLCSQDVIYYVVNIDLIAPFTFTAATFVGSSFTQANLFIPSPNPSNVRYVEFANNALGQPTKILSFSMLTDAFVATTNNITNVKYISLLYDTGGGPPVDYITINRDSGVTTVNNVQDACTGLNAAQLEIRTNLTNNYTNNTALGSALTLKYDASNPAGYQTAANVSSSLVPYLLSATAASTYATLTQFSYLLRPNIRIVVASGGSTTPASGQSYSTIESAVAAALSGQSVVICPGTYTLAGPLTIPSGISIVGFDKKTCIIQYTSSTNNTMITMGSGTSLSSLTILHSCSTNGVACNTIGIIGTDNLTCDVTNCVITSTHSGTTGNMNIISCSATGVYNDPSAFTIKNCDMTVSSSSSGALRAISVTGSGTLAVDTCQISALRTSGSGTGFIACETNNASCVLTLTNSYVSGFSNDISQTQGSIRLGKSTVLVNVSANDLSFSILGSGESWHYGDVNGLDSGTKYFYRGMENVDNNEIQLRIARPMILYNMYVHAMTPPGTGNNTVFTVRKNATNTLATLTLSGTANSINGAFGVKFVPGDLISVQAVRTGAGIANVTILLDFY